MRVCMVTSVPMPPGEGVGYYVWNLSRYLVELGHQVQIVTRGQSGTRFHERMGDISVWRPRFSPVYPVHVHLHGLFVRRLVRRLEPEVDVFHLHTPLPPAIQTCRPRLVTVHTPMIGEARAIAVRNLWTLAIRLQIPVSVALERRLFANADGLVTVSNSVAKELSGYGVTRDRVRVLGNGVDTRVFWPCQPGQKARTDEPYILAAGRLDARKGFSDLIEAMVSVASRFPSVCLYVAGSGPLERELKTLVARRGLERTVRFLGHVSQDTMVNLYGGATVFVHAAHYEGLPTVLLEAMACGKAVVSTSVSGALDVVEDGVNGLLVPPKMPERLAEGICRLLDDGDLQHRLGIAARRTVEQRFSWQVVGESYLRVYRDLLAGKAR